jgi:hypothetical protein
LLLYGGEASMKIDVIVSTIIGAIAAMAGWIARLLWDFYKYREMRMGEYVLQFALIPKIYYSGKFKLVDVTIRMKNIGRGAAFIKCPSIKGSQNPILEVRVVPIGPQDSVIFWDNLSPLLPSIEFLKDFYLPRTNDLYIIEPGDTAIEHACFTTSYDGILFLRLSVWDHKGYRGWDQEIVDLRKTTSPNTA